MEQLNNALSPMEEENKDAVASIPKSMETPLFDKVRQKFEITGLISLIFGLMFALSFYDAGFGMNAFFFTGVMVILLIIVMKRFAIPMKGATYLYYGASLLLGLSSAMTSNGSIQFMNTIGTIFLLNLSILHQLHKDGKWEFAEHFGKMIGMLFHGIAAIPYPFVDCVRYMKRTKFLRMTG
jgi:membrane protein YdbS with pleckstrin-like domain